MRSTTRMAMTIVLAAVALGWLAWSLGAGPDPEEVPTVEAVLSRTMSPFCPGLTMEECPSAQATEVRRQIASRIAQGQTNRQIDGWLVANFGRAVLGRPSGPWWMVPVAALGIGYLVIAMRMKRMSTRPAPAPISQQDRDLVERELGSFKESTE